MAMEGVSGGWRITRAERERTGIERFRILQTGDPSHFVFDCVERRAGLPAGDYSQVEIELVIANDAGSAAANLIARRGDWFLPKRPAIR
ncbi:MAG: hypothetical protein HYT78_04790 [Deltaproteobacteria bacterium]|nr:hypothetical protein [Deltaproteobacteria bacterium]